MRTFKIVLYAAGVAQLMHRVMTGLSDCLLLGVTSRGGLTHCLESRSFVIRISHA